MATKTATSSKKHSTTTEHKRKPSDSSMLSLIKENRVTISAIAAEFIGTFLLVASVFSLQSSPIYLPLAIIGIVLIIGGISGAHLNPAMTIGALVTKKISGLKSVMYIVAQLLGSGAAWLMLSAFAKCTNADSTAPATVLFHAAKLSEANINAGRQWYLFAAELLGALILGFGISAILKNKSKNSQSQSAITYGFVFFVAFIIAYSATSAFYEQGTSIVFLNPAVALAANAMADVWTIAIYAFAPILGAVIGFVLNDLMSPKATTIKE